MSGSGLLHSTRRTSVLVAKDVDAAIVSVRTTSFCPDRTPRRARRRLLTHPLARSSNPSHLGTETCRLREDSPPSSTSATCPQRVPEAPSSLEPSPPSAPLDSGASGRATWKSGKSLPLLWTPRFRELTVYRIQTGNCSAKRPGRGSTSSPSSSPSRTATSTEGSRLPSPAKRKS